MSLSTTNSSKSNVLQAASSTRNNNDNNKKGTANNSKEKPQTSQIVSTTQADAKTDESLLKTVNSREEFDKLITTIKDKHILVWFSANWCGPCKMLAMKFNDLAEKYRNKIVVLKVDVTDLEDLALENGVSTMPSYMLMLNGLKLAHYFGSKQEQIDEMIEKYLEKAS